MTLRVRFAPSPTGTLHVGGARTALFNWLLARKEGGAFLLRIEDTDRERSSPEMVRAILEGLEWLGLDWDEPPSYQSEGADRHRADVRTLLERGLAYRDFSDPDQLVRLRAEDPDRAHRYPREEADRGSVADAEKRAAAGEPHAVRLRVPDGVTEWEDQVHGRVRFRNEDLEDLVLLRADGTPTYNLAVASDDAHMQISHVIRGDDHLSNTPKQILLHRLLDRPVPVFAHVPMILGSDGKRLSKRHGAASLADYADQGILPQTMMNFLALLGWSPGTDEEVFTPVELVDRFSLDRVVKKSAVFDPRKLEWLNGRHLSRMTADELDPLVLTALGADRAGVERWRAEDPDGYARAVELYRDRSRSVPELAEELRTYGSDEVTYDPEAVAKHWNKDPDAVRLRLSALRDRLDGATWEPEALEEALRELAGEMGVGAGKLIHPLRVALTGRAASPGIFDVLVLLGRDRAQSRLDAAIARLTGVGPRGS